MIPKELRLQGFLSYRDESVLDFSAIHTACISGSNGAGKSSLLDAMTWALFGNARATRDDEVINLQSDLARVSFTFEHEGNTYRVMRAKPRGKTSQVEFQIQQRDGSWKPLTERSIRETNRRIVDTLRLDYETFTNAAFFLQGQAASFSQKTPAERKRILANILGLEQWEIYRQRTIAARKAVEQESNILHYRLEEIEAELQEEDARRQQLAELEAELQRHTAHRKTQEKALEQMRLLAFKLAQEEKRVDDLAAQVDLAQKQVTTLEERLQVREKEYNDALEVGARAQEIEAAHEHWQQLRRELQAWDEVAARFRQHQERRRVPLEAIQMARARLEQERQTLSAQQEASQKKRQQQTETEAELTIARQKLQEITERLADEESLRKTREKMVSERAHLETENTHLKSEMKAIKQRQKRLTEIEGATCPLCGQPLGETERATLIEQLQADGTRLGDAYRANQKRMAELQTQITAIGRDIEALGQLARQRQQQAAHCSTLEERLRRLTEEIQAWETTQRPRLEEVTRILAKEDYAHEARAQLAEIDAEGLAIGYDAAAHEDTRQAEAQARQVEDEMRKLDIARTSLNLLEREIDELHHSLEEQRAHLEDQRQAYEQAKQQLEESRHNLPDIAQAEQALNDLLEKENQLNLEVHAARQRVNVLTERRRQRKELLQQFDALQLKISRYKQLETAFGKNGIPALLIEAALPEIETYANEILDRLSNGSMNVHFATQRAYKDSKRQHEKRETLDIHIRDANGEREYAMYSGGEAFRVDFAIRLALSRLLAQRAGARLQTLVIDEGFGSQDEQGRQRLVEAINEIQGDFEKILVITHVESLKEAFPARIEVEKSPQGSFLRVS